ncbi:MAG: outer membrane lipoprotein-sorting protein [Chitinispirillaceae bacterium]|nr:outer membrane lipoprotein-sorting protein [Chitinispirillaceae bacterium]
MPYHRISVSLVPAAVMAASLCVQAAPPVDSLLEKMEDNISIATDARAQVTLTQQKPGQGVKNFEMMYYRRDKDNAFLIVFSAPESEKGNGYLRIGDNFWMYRRNTRTFQHINRDESIGGSDASGEDFETRKLTELYKPATDSAGMEIIREEKLGPIPVYRFEVRARVSDVSYPYKTFWVRTDNFLLLKEQSFSSSKTLMNTAYYRKYTTVLGKFVPVQQLFIDEFEKGNKTIVEISGIVTEKLDDRIFTKAYLENLSK